MLCKVGQLFHGAYQAGSYVYCPLCEKPFSRTALAVRGHLNVHIRKKELDLDKRREVEEQMLKTSSLAG